MGFMKLEDRGMGRGRAWEGEEHGDRGGGRA